MFSVIESNCNMGGFYFIFLLYCIGQNFQYNVEQKCLEQTFLLVPGLKVSAMVKFKPMNFFWVSIFLFCFCFFFLLFLLHFVLSFFFLFFLNFIYLFYFWLCWVFVSVQGLSLIAASGGLSLSRPLLLRSTGSRRAGCTEYFLMLQFYLCI